MPLTVNGIAVPYPGNISLESYLKSRAIEPRGIVVELNGEIVQRERCAQVELADNDTLEILRFVGGGA